MASLLQTIRLAEPSERARVAHALSRAFAADPVARWLYPDDDQYRRYFPQLVDVLGGPALDRGTAYCMEECAATALWMPPGVGPDGQRVAAILTESISDPEKRALALAVFEEMACHHPSHPHWYLPFLGVVPSHHGKGYGSALLETSLRLFDADASPAYLEATSRRSVALSERYGFEVVGLIQVGSSPPLYPMVRTPRRLRPWLKATGSRSEPDQ